MKISYKFVIAPFSPLVLIWFTVAVSEKESRERGYKRQVCNISREGGGRWWAYIYLYLSCKFYIFSFFVPGDNWKFFFSCTSGKTFRNYVIAATSFCKFIENYRTLSLPLISLHFLLTEIQSFRKNCQENEHEGEERKRVVAEQSEEEEADGSDAIAEKFKCTSLHKRETAKQCQKPR